MMKYLEYHGVEETANRYHVCRKTVWKWKQRWNGTAASLEEQSRRPHSFPHAQEAWEIKLVQRMRKKYAEYLLLGYQKACQDSYKRRYGCFKRTAVQEIPPQKKPKRSKNKPYQRAEYPGQKVQIDVKYVPSYCVADGNKYYQYTAKDEWTRWTTREMYCVTGKQKGEFMKTGLIKQEKTTDIWFDEKAPYPYPHPQYCLKKRLLAYSRRYLAICQQTDTDPETGCMEFDIEKGRFSFRLTAPYSEERREAARQYARENNATSRLK